MTDLDFENLTAEQEDWLLKEVKKLQKRQESGELAILFPGREISAGGETFTLSPFKFGQLPTATRLLKPVAGALSAGGVFSIQNVAGETQFLLASDWPLKVVELIADGGEDVLKFVAFASGKPIEWVNGLDADEGIALAKAVLEVNADFFVRRVLPLLGMGQPSAGAISSESSSPAVTDAPTSTDTPSDSSSSTSEPPSVTAGA